MRAAGIRCERPEVSPALPAHVHEPLGWVAREAATNVLRHSSATWCEITVEAGRDRVRVEIVNDGAGRRRQRRGQRPDRPRRAHHGRGGEFTAGPVSDGTFRVTAAVPATTEGVA